MKVQSRARNQVQRARNRAQASRQKRAQARTRNQVQRAKRSTRRLEALIFVAVLAVAIGGLYFAYFGTGQAIRRLPACTGGYIIPHMSFTGLSANYFHEYKFRGIEGTVELVDIKDQGARFNIDGVMTPYLQLTDSWLGEQVGIKIGSIDKYSVGVCLASAVPECIDYYWDIDTRRRECGRWQSQADSLF